MSEGSQLSQGRWLGHVAQESQPDQITVTPTTLLNAQFRGPTEHHLNWVFICNKSILRIIP